MRLTLKSFVFFSVLAGFISLLWLLILPVDVKNEWFLGYSKNRIMMTGLMGGILSLLGLIYWFASTNKSFNSQLVRMIGALFSQKKYFATLILVSLFLIFAGLLFLISLFFITDEFIMGILVRILPWIFFLTTLSLQVLLFFYFNDLVSEKTLVENRVYLSNQLILFSLFFCFILINLGSIQKKSFTTDELFHYQYGANILDLNSDRFDDSKMPFSALNAIVPKVLAWLLHQEKIHLTYPLSGRIFTILFSTFSSYFVYRWSRSLYGRLAGFFSFFLYVTDPNIIAHSRLITTDIYATGMILITLYSFWLFSKKKGSLGISGVERRCGGVLRAPHAKHPHIYPLPRQFPESQKKNWKYAFLSAVSLGLSQLAKYTSAYLYPLLAGIVIIQEFPVWKELIQTRAFRELWKKSIKGFKYMFFYALISLVIINIGFLFNRTLTPLNEYTFRSELFQTIQAELSAFGSLPIPVPYPYLEGLDWVKERERTGHGTGSIYLFGELHEVELFNGYFIFAALLKVPIAVQILIALGIIKFILERSKHDFLKNELFLIAPIIFFFIYFNFLFRTQIGIRFYLVIFPFLYILCGNLLQTWSVMRKGAKIFFVGLSGFLIGSVAAAYPHYIPYFNEFIGDQKNAYKYLIDSNLDWYQAEWYLHQFLEQNPEAIYEPLEPTSGLIVVSPNRLVGLFDPDKFRWLRENFEPVDTIADVYLVYDLSVDEIEQISR